MEKAKRIKRAEKQEISFCQRTRDPSYHMAGGRPIDALVFRDKAIIDVIDCKFSDKKEFIIWKGDIRKGLQHVAKLKQKGFNARFCIDMHFPKSRKRRKIYIAGESWKGGSIKTWVTAKKIMSKEVFKEKHETYEKRLSTI